MFTVDVGLNTYQVSYADGGFTAKAKNADGNEDTDAVVALAEIAFAAVKARAEYAPSGAMIEFYTAQEMGVEVEPPQLENEPGFTY